MVLKGHCIVQNCESHITIEELPSGNLQEPDKVIYGLIKCPFADTVDKCNVECSILKQYGIKR